MKKIFHSSALGTVFVDISRILQRRGFKLSCPAVGKMDHGTLLQALEATTLADEQKKAGEFLDQCVRHQGFTPELLKIACNVTYSNTVRQAAVIYLKNSVSKYWEKDEDEDTAQNESTAFVLPEDDKDVIRRNIVEAICVSRDTTRTTLCTTIGMIMRVDFPSKWPNLCQQIEEKLTSNDLEFVLSALMVLCKLAKIYEYKRSKDRSALQDVTDRLLPIVQQQLIQLLPINSFESVTIEKQILKLFFSLFQFSLNLKMLSTENIGIWLTACRNILDRDTPPEVKSIEDPDEAEEMVWWKCKKWAAKILEKFFERYGAPGQVESMYSDFATHFLNHLGIPCVETMLKLLDNKRNGIYVSNRVLQLALNFLNTAVSHSHTWIVIKPHAQEIFASVIFPILCITQEDQETWEADPEEYVRLKFDIFEDFHNPSYAASAMLVGIAKRKDMMHPILAFCINILSQSQDPTQLEGVLRIVGELAVNLIKSKKYKKDLEKLLDAHVISRTTHPSKFVRSRALWVIKEYSAISFSNNKILKKAVTNCVERLVDEKEELPVKVEAAIAIQMLLTDQEKVEEMIRPLIQQVILRVMELVAQSKVEDMVSVMDELLEKFMEEIIPIAVDVADKLTKLFINVLGSEEADDRGPTLMSIISTLGNVLDLIDEHREIMVKVEVHILELIHHVFAVAAFDYFEDVLGLLQSLLNIYVSEPMWMVLNELHVIFKEHNNALATFVEIAPVLHLYIVTDTDSFLARNERLTIVLEMCQIVLQDNEQDEENQLHAVKILEVLILQCGSAIKEAFPHILSLTVHRLSQPFENGLHDLKAMLTLVLAASIYQDIPLTMTSLQQLLPNHPNPLDFICQLLVEQTEHFEGIHSKKMAIIGWCILLKLPAQYRPAIINQDPKKVIDSCIKLFDSLEKVLKAEAAMKNTESDDEDEEESEEDDEDIQTKSGKGKKRNVHRKMDEDLSDDEDHIDQVRKLCYLSCFLFSSSSKC
ncbi:hypothetical protein WR25_07919 [Diploscapter pachys]|uniref:Importin N-terminal domain-containing protein n=1 Tax=Diploscapter pachys TaxID=2018661 RepID=A0A2A2J8X3_9BILA|nr:hypothetical protein WR25_07919 [Diploscapter pachys]